MKRQWNGAIRYWKPHCYMIFGKWYVTPIPLFILLFGTFKVRDRWRVADRWTDSANLCLTLAREVERKANLPGSAFGPINGKPWGGPEFMRKAVSFGHVSKTGIPVHAFRHKRS